MGGQTGAGNFLADIVPTTGEAPPRRREKLAGVLNPRTGEGGRCRRRRQAEKSDRMAQRLVGQPPFSLHGQGVGEHELYNALRESRRETKLDSAPEGVTQEGHPFQVQLVKGGNEFVQYLR